MANFVHYGIEMRFIVLPLGVAVVASLVGCSPSATNIDSFSNNLPFDSPASFSSFLDEAGYSCRISSSNNNGRGFWEDDYWGEGSVVECFDPSDEPYWVFIAAEPDWKYRLCISRDGYPGQENSLSSSIQGYFSGWGDATIVGQSYFLSVMYPEDSFYTMNDWQKILDGEVYESDFDFCKDYRQLWEEE